MTPKFKIGDLICKPKGYAFDGVIVSVFVTTKGEARVVAELKPGNGAGMLHIFSEDQLEKAPCAGDPLDAGQLQRELNRQKEISSDRLVRIIRLETYFEKLAHIGEGNPSGYLEINSIAREALISPKTE
jgi:hypothetical protein